MTRPGDPGVHLEGSSPVELRAVLHVHTTASDGTGSYRDVIGEARAAGLDVIGFNDHNTLEAREMGLGGRTGELFVLAGAELEDEHENNHLLVYGVDSIPATTDPHEQIEAVNAAGGIAIIAHPCEGSGSIPGTRSYRWTAGETTGAAGVEVWNYMSDWKGGLNPLNLVPRLILPDRWVRDPDRSAVELWEATGGCAIACPDAHAFRYGAGPLSIEVFPYRMLFGRLVTHILLDSELPEDDAEAERRLLQALREGSCFQSNRLHGDATGFRALWVGDDLLVYVPGDGELHVTAGGSSIAAVGTGTGVHRIPASERSRVVVRVLRNGRTWICACLP